MNVIHKKKKKKPRLSKYSYKNPPGTIAYPILTCDSVPTRQVLESRTLLYMLLPFLAEGDVHDLMQTCKALCKRIMRADNWWQKVALQLGMEPLNLKSQLYPTWFRALVYKKRKIYQWCRCRRERVGHDQSCITCRKDPAVDAVMLKHPFHRGKGLIHQNLEAYAHWKGIRYRQKACPKLSLHSMSQDLYRPFRNLQPSSPTPVSLMFMEKVIQAFQEVANTYTTPHRCPNVSISLPDAERFNRIQAILLDRMVMPRFLIDLLIQQRIFHNPDPNVGLWPQFLRQLYETTDAYR
jgi:hypothetical protein